MVCVVGSRSKKIHTVGCLSSHPPPHSQPQINDMAHSIIKSMGLSIADFNTITRRLAQDPQLRQRVLKQAYLYRLEAKINDKCVQLCVCV